MFINENRNCYTYENNCEEEERRIDCAKKEELLQNIRCLEFAINELALYLDTHPEDRKALCLPQKILQ